MVYKSNYIELWVNGNKVELEDQESVNMRFNNVMFDPTKISSTQAEYSFEFEVPCTPKNNIIFDYANNLAKLNKFHQRYDAEVYADGTVIFTGTITVNGVKDNRYNLNLVSVKVYSLEEIFGDMTMNQIKNMNISFSGISSINYINDLPTQANTMARFPLVSYGAFQKSPSATSESFNDYSSKYDLDEWNRWYVEDFFPSHSLLQTIKKAFETKGYKVTGDIFQNKYLKEIYMSGNLADGQDPEYNVGNPNFGLVDLDVTMTTQLAKGYEQELKFPYFKVYNGRAEYGPETYYNWENIDIFDVLDSGSTITVNHTPSYMYQPNEGIIVIPADGWYKVELSANTTVTTTGNLTVGQYILDPQTEFGDVEKEDVTVSVGIGEITPIEIQLVRNYDDNIELIKGKNNKKYRTGNPNGAYDTWDTCYPHEDPYASDLPTKENDLTSKNRQSRLGGKRDGESTTTSEGGNYTNSTSGNFIGRRGGTRGGTIDPYSPRRFSSKTFGYVYGTKSETPIMAYDQAVSDTFICGLSSLSGGIPAVMKNGYSWSPITAEKNEIFAPVNGYYFLYREDGSQDIHGTKTDHNENSYINSPVGTCYNTNNNKLEGRVCCMVYLYKNDVLSLKTIHRAYDTAIGNKVSYSSTTNAHLSIRAFSERSQNSLKASHDNRYEAPVEFSQLLNLANFLNSETKVSDWVQNVIDAFNLEVIQDGSNIIINTKKKLNTDVLTTVDIDNKANTANAESKKIDYPKSMAVKYKIDTDEWGFERSAVEAAGGDETILDNDDWEKYGDSGYTVVQLNDDSYVTSTSDKNLQFSYTWYQNFNWYAVDSAFTRTSDTAVTVKMPCISKFSYMIDGYDYEESMKHDGFGLPQRFWFKPVKTQQYVWTRTYPPEKAYISVPKNLDGINLSYKITEPSLLTEFFNTNSYLSSNYVEIDVYLTADEYNRIKNGALVHFGSDLYIPVQIDGYDPSGVNATTLVLMKKVI